MTSTKRDLGELKMKMQEVKRKAKTLGINSFGKTKVELVREIQIKEGNFPCYGTAVDYCDQYQCCFRASCLKEDKLRGESKRKE